MKTIFNRRAAQVLAKRDFFDYGVRLASGRLIPICWNPKRSLAHPDVLRTVAEEFAKLIKRVAPKTEVILGGATGGIGLAVATAMVLNLPWAYVRGTAKGHGTNVLVEGDFRHNAQAVLVDDTIATGATKALFIRNARNQLRITDIIVILDDTGGRMPSWLKRSRIRLYSLMTKEARDRYFYHQGLFNETEWELEEAYEQDRTGWQRDRSLVKKMVDLKKLYG